MSTVERAEPRRLPPGSHGIPADVVARNQRERLIAAMVESCAAHGYVGASVTDLVKRAGISSVTFYKQFADKPDCLFAAHRQLLGRFLEEVDRVLGAAAEGRQARIRAVIHTALGLFAADPPSARLLTVEILAAGSEGAKRHDAMVEALAERLGADWVLTAGMLALIGKLVIAGEAVRLPELEDEFVALVAPDA